MKMLVHAGPHRGRPPAAALLQAGPPHFPPVWLLSPWRWSDVWQPASPVQVCSRKMDRNVPLGEDCALVVVVPACHVLCA